MITVSRAVLKHFRQWCRRAGLHKFRNHGGPVVTLTGGGDALAIRCQSPDVAIEYHQPGPNDAEVIRLPWNALDSCEGRDDDPVTMEARSGNRTLLSWVDRAVPRQSEQVQARADTTAFPPIPTTFEQNEPRLWQALRDAVATTDESSTRYALACLHLCGRSGRIEATDGRQVLVQSGFRFGWDDDVLVPGSKLLGCADLDLGEEVAVGRSGEWIGLKVGGVSVLLRIQKEGRFPKIDQLLPNPDAAPSRLELSPDDARFLADVLPRLPTDDAVHHPVTLDLNGQVLVRCRLCETDRPTEVRLTSSQLVGEPVLLHTNRCYVERALKLGFRQVRLYGPNSPALCVADDRRYLWALLDKESAIKPSKDAIRIESTAKASVPHVRTIKPKEVTVTVPLTTAAASTETKPAVCVRTRISASSVEQAIALRDVLRNAARQAGDLARSLKQHKRQARIVASTLASLKELQKVAG